MPKKTKTISKSEEAKNILKQELSEKIKKHSESLKNLAKEINKDGLMLDIAMIVRKGSNEPMLSIVPKK